MQFAKSQPKINISFKHHISSKSVTSKYLTFIKHV
ncbi:hypothetical protein Leryth_019863 [Lithospermum erythrorhizon]|nr:hypothetical protein Leryth_019863 [Lithospermum erythrorhizon]